MKFGDGGRQEVEKAKGLWNRENEKLEKREGQRNSGVELLTSRRQMQASSYFVNEFHVRLPLPFLTWTESATLNDAFCNSRIIN